jgi:Ser/Thr protein kinase RdoA (MazF antagonist)
MNQDAVARALDAYGIQPLFIHPAQKGYRNESFAVDTEDGQTLNIMFYKREAGIVERIKRANHIADIVASQGFPARQTWSKKILRLKAGAYEKYASVYNYLPGHTIPWEAYNQDHIKLLGKTMSDMHAILASCDAPDLPEVTDEYLAIVKRMRHYFAQAPVQRALADKLLLEIDMVVFDQFEQLLIGAKLLPGKQPLHMDFVRSNILFENEPEGDFKVRISGILDFEKTAYGHPIFDIARTLAFLLVDCKYKQADKVRKYFLGSGYIKRGEAMLAEKHLGILDDLVSLFAYYDFYKFLRHNPYESLHDNEHFVRTVSMLIPARLVVPTTLMAT